MLLKLSYKTPLISCISIKIIVLYFLKNTGKFEKKKTESRSVKSYLLPLEESLFSIYSS